MFKPRVQLDLGSACNASEHMLADSLLFGESSSDQLALRLYDWKAPAVTLGRFQDPSSAIGAKCGDWAVRPTGGYAVLHGHDLTVALAMPSSDLEKSKSPKYAYELLSKVIIGGIQRYGIDCSISGKFKGDKHSNADCFMRASAYDIVEAGTQSKICGCALQVNRKGYLLQCSIPLHAPKVQVGDWIIGASHREVMQIEKRRLIESLLLSFQGQVEELNRLN